ncbi:MAG: hypothetical protein HIU88_12475 [Acidobacteria bacterium]|nr:hypothetical protein [Acidobacteriota bacterium]
MILPGNGFANDLSQFGSLMDSPVQVLVPLIAAWLGCGALYAEVGNRFLTSQRARVGAGRLLTTRLGLSAVIPFLVLTAFVLVTYWLAFVLLPNVGDPFVNAALYPSPSESGGSSETSLFSYSQLTANGDFAFGLFYACWFGFCGAVYGSLTAGLLLVLPNRAIALVVPTALLVVETIAAALSGSPYAGLLYSMVPFALQQAPILTAARPTLILAAVSATLWLFIAAKKHDLPTFR